MLSLSIEMRGLPTRPYGETEGVDRSWTLCDILSGVLRQDLVDERLITNSAAARFSSEHVEHCRVYADGDQLLGTVAEGWSSDSAHGLQLLCGRVDDVGEVNLSRCTLRAPAGSLCAR